MVQGSCPIHISISLNPFNRSRYGRVKLADFGSSPEREHTSIQAPISLCGIYHAVRTLLRLSNSATQIDAVGTPEL